MNTDFGTYIKELVKKFRENGISAEEKSLQYGCVQSTAAARLFVLRFRAVFLPPKAASENPPAADK